LAHAINGNSLHHCGFLRVSLSEQRALSFRVSALNATGKRLSPRARAIGYSPTKLY